MNVRQWDEYAGAVQASAEAADRKARVDAAFRACGYMAEKLTVLEEIAADLDDDRLSVQVERLRLPLTGAGNRLAHMRKET